jgi:transposase
MIRITFTESDINTLHKERFQHPDPRVQLRLEIVYLKGLGYSHQEIGRITQVSQKTVRRCLRLYCQGGIDALKADNSYRPTSQLEQHRNTIEAEFKAKPPKSVAEARESIEELTGIRRSPSQVRNFLKRLGMKRCKAGQIPAKADVEKQEAFLKDELEPRLEEARQGRRHVFFVDAAHFVLQPFLNYLWCFVRIFIKAPCGRQRFNVLGALNAVSLELTTVTNDSYINAESVVQLLHQLALKYVNLPITLVLDNARYQKCKYVKDIADRLGIELLFLPPYSPNLNLIERLWKFVKKECLYSTYHENFTDFKKAITDCLTGASNEHKAALSRLLTHNFQTFKNVTLCPL